MDKVDGRAPDSAHAEFYVLGPLRVVVDDIEVSIAARRQRALLVLLLMSVGRVVPAERLIEQLWDGAPPPQAAVTLRSYVSNLRQALGGRARLGSALVTRGQGYCLEVPPMCVDAVRLATLSEQGRDHLRNDRPGEALVAFSAAVRSWSGDPLAEIADHHAAQSTITQLTETYLGAVEGRFAALLATGHHADALPALEAFTADHPLREEPRVLLMLALYRSGRAAEALEVHREFRVLLRDELGIDPSAHVDQLTQQILTQDPALEAPQRVPTNTEAEAAPTGPTPARQRIVGRRRELELLRGRLDTLVSSGSGALLLVAGEPGIGKTTMLEALEHEARAQGVAVHTGRAPAASGAPAFWPWSQVLDSIAAGLDDESLRRACAGSARPVAQLSAAVAERTGHPLPMTGDNPQTLRFLLYEAVSTFIAQACAEEPVVITIDDLQWADLPSLELLSYLTPGLGVRPVLVVAAYRDLAAARTEALEATLATVSRENVAHELVLAGLGPADIAELADHLVGSSPDDETREQLAALLHERTGGNPFFVRQLVRLMAETDSGSTDLQSVPIPPGVRHVVASRLRGLSPAVDTLLAAAAVVGREFDLRVAGAAAKMPPAAALDAFDEAADHGLVEVTSGGPGARRFVHALVQEVVLQRLSTSRTAALHAAVAAQLQREGTASSDELAAHLWAAREVVGTAAIPAQLAAADAAAGVFAHEQAEMHLRRALDLVRTSNPPAPSQELAILMSLFRLIVVARGWGDLDAAAVADRALQLAEAGAIDDDTAPLWWLLFNFLLDHDDRASYVEVARTLLAAVEDEASSAGHASLGAVHLMNTYGCLALGDRAAARAHLDGARAHLDVASDAAVAAFEVPPLLSVLLTEGYWAAMTGDRETYRSAVDGSIALADADGRPFTRAVARTMAAISAPYLEDVQLAGTLASQALDLDRHFGFGWLETLAASVESWVTARRGDNLVDAARRLEATLDTMIAGQRRSTQSTILLMLADVYGLAGRTDEARAALVRARERPGPYQGLFVDLVDRRLRE